MRRGLVAWAVAVAAFAALPGASAQVPPHARDVIVRIRAIQCAGQATIRVGTGFLWHSSTQVVTALHVVSGCGSIIVHSEHDQNDFAGSVARVDREADLALMTLDGPVSVTPAVETSIAPQMGDTLVAFGYGDGIPKMRSYGMPVAFGPPTLDENVPDDVHAALKTVGTPALNVRVVAIDAPIAAGLSGAPLVDDQGRVRAIADGGVNHGVTHTSWAIPASYLTELLSSTDPVDQYVGTNAALSAAEQTRATVFSADFVPENAPTVACGNATLRLVRAQAFADVAAMTDSPLGLTQLQTILGAASRSFVLDIYSDATSGATVALPSGTTLTRAGDYCVAAAAGGRMDVRIQVLRLAQGQDGQVASQAFEAAAGSPPINAWVTDPAWTMVVPFTRADGLIVRRKAFMKLFPPNPLGAPTQYLFETLAIRNGTFVGVAARRLDDYTLMLCVRGLQVAGCPPPSDAWSWQELALAVHLTTFPTTAGGQGGGVWQER